MKKKLEVPHCGDVALPEEFATRSLEAIDEYYSSHYESGHALTFCSVRGLMAVCIQSYRELQQDADEEGWLHIVSMMDRTAFQAFSARVEHDLFPPNTEKNDEYVYRMLSWPTGEARLPWVVVSLPWDYKEKLTPFLEEFQFRLADGVPHMIHGKEMQRFPMSSPRVWVLEYERNHPAYGANPRELEVMRRVGIKRFHQIMKTATEGN